MIDFSRQKKEMNTDVDKWDYKASELYTYNDYEETQLAIQTYFELSNDIIMAKEYNENFRKIINKKIIYLIDNRKRFTLAENIELHNNLKAMKHNYKLEKLNVERSITFLNNVYRKIKQHLKS